MIKAKQTVEYMVKLQCEQSGIMEGSMDSMIRRALQQRLDLKVHRRALLTDLRHRHKSRQKTAITVPTMQTRPTTCCPRRSTLCRQRKSGPRQTPVRGPFPAVKTSFRFRALRKWHPAHRPLKVCRPDRPRDHPDRPDPCPHAEETGYRGDLRTSDHNGSSRDHSPGD